MAANRDEFYARPTALADFWDDNPSILAGRDLQAGGTWLGMNRSGRMAAITNFREGRPEPAPLSRGKLSSLFLNEQSPAFDFAEKLQSSQQQYNGFNLLIADDQQLVYCSNRTQKIQILEPGIYSLSNHLLNSPWPKAEHAKEELSQLILNAKIDQEDLIQCLQRRDPFPDEQLPSTGVGLEMERTLSPPFIAIPEYGTRCTTTILWKHDGSVRFAEQNYLPGGEPGQRREFAWQAGEG